MLLTFLLHRKLEVILGYILRRVLSNYLFTLGIKVYIYVYVLNVWMKCYWNLPVSRCNKRSGVAYRICGTLQEFRVLLNRISTSSLNSFGSFLIDWGIVTELVSEREGCRRSLKCTLSIHWLMSDIQAAFSCIVGATKCTDTWNNQCYMFAKYLM